MYIYDVTQVFRNNNYGDILITLGVENRVILYIIVLDWIFFISVNSMCFFFSWVHSLYIFFSCNDKRLVNFELLTRDLMHLVKKNNGNNNQQRNFLFLKFNKGLSELNKQKL